MTTEELLDKEIEEVEGRLERLKAARSALRGTPAARTRRSPARRKPTRRKTSTARRATRGGAKHKNAVLEGLAQLGGRARASEIAEAANLRLSSVTDALKLLAEDGSVERSAEKVPAVHPGQRRSYVWASRGET